jgi:hypothetical protein
MIGFSPKWSGSTGFMPLCSFAGILGFHLKKCTGWPSGNFLHANDSYHLSASFIIFYKDSIMSAISSVSTVSLWTKDSKPDLGQVLVVARGNEKTKTKTVCASLAVIPDTQIMEPENLSRLVPHIQAMIHAQRIKLVRMYTPKGEIREEQASLGAVLDSMDAEGRLTKESIAEFLSTESNAETLRALFAEKLKYHNVPLSEQQLKKLDSLKESLISKLQELAGRTYWEPEKVVVAKGYIEMLEDTPIRTKMLAKCEEMENKKPSEDIMEALGF